jgi:hypothetical protein
MLKTVVHLGNPGGEDALAGDDQTIAEGSDGGEEGLGVGGKWCDRRMMLAGKWAAKTLASEDASFPGEMRRFAVISV